MFAANPERKWRKIFGDNGKGIGGGIACSGSANAGERNRDRGLAINHCVLAKEDGFSRRACLDSHRALKHIQDYDVGERRQYDRRLKRTVIEQDLVGRPSALFNMN